MTDEEYKAKMLEALNDIRDYQKTILVYLEAMASSPEFESAKQDLAKKVSDMGTIFEITKRRWSA